MEGYLTSKKIPERAKAVELPTADKDGDLVAQVEVEGEEGDQIVYDREEECEPAERGH